MAVLGERISSISERIPLPIFLAIVAVAFVMAVIIVISIHVHNESKERKRRKAVRRIRSDFGDSGYRSEILNSLPAQEQLDFSNLYRRLDELQSFIDQNKRQFESLESQAIDRVEKKIKDSQNQIRNKWNYLKNKRNFHHCICVHYASFTLADSIKRQQENIRNVYVKYKKECDQLAGQIEFLNLQIVNSNGQKKYEYMQQHKACCTRHQRLSKLKNVFAARNTQYLQMVKEQNAYTKQYREYIISNFGEKGRIWGERLKQRKADLIGNS